MAQGEFLWCDLAAFDVEAVLPVYSQLLDWTYRSETLADESVYHYASNDRDVTAGIYEMPDIYREEGMKSYWMSYVGIDDIVDGLDIVEAQGGKVILGPASFGQGASIAMVADPMGAILTLFLGSHLQHRPQKMRHGSHFWNELFTDDLDRAQSFYGELFGWTFEPSEDGVSLNVRNLAGSPTTRIQPLSETTPSGSTPHWVVSFAATELETISARAAELHLRHEIAPGMQGSKRLCVLDPNGAPFYVVPVDRQKMSWFS